MPQAKRKRSILQSQPRPGPGKRQKQQAPQKKQQGGASQHVEGANGGGKRAGKGQSGGGGRPDAAAAAAAPAAQQPRSRPAGAGGRASSSAGGWQCRSVIDRQAAEAVARLLAAAETRSGGATIKSLTLAPHVVHKKPTFAVTCETLKHLPLLKQLLAEVPLLEDSPELPAPAAYVLCYEVLFGQGLRERGPAERAVMARRGELKAALGRLLAAAGAKTASELLSRDQGAAAGGASQPPPHPRWVRVNTLKASVDWALQQLRADPATAAAEVDDLLPEVLRLPAGTDLHDHPLVQSGHLILQSKASCMPARALAPQPGWAVLDACAAPGNKTTHAAALVARGGRVLAFDRDAKRLRRLVRNAERAGAAGIVEARCADFLSLEPTAPEFAEVRGIILDPSCSGSGTAVSRMDHLLPKAGNSGGARGGGGDGGGDDDGGGGEAQRIEQLARFQEAALRHALSFPGLLRLAYSTCSVHRRENEDVVASALPAASEAGFELVDAFPPAAWPRRGLPGSLPGGGEARVVRTDAVEDGTDGFFVAVFERRRSGGGGGGAGGGEEAGGGVQQPAGGVSEAKKNKKKKKKP